MPYINREELLKDINETVVFTVRKGVQLPTAEMRGANKVIDRIKSAPTADVVEVVRCKDCEHLKDGYDGYWCQIHSKAFDKFFIYNLNHFCSYGKRKGD